MSTQKPLSTPFLRSILGQRLADFLTPEANGFSAVRLLLALAVLVSHAFMLRYGTVNAEPLIGLTGYTLGQHAVQGFFILSGLLVAQSLMHARKAWHFATARALRIFPALAVCVVITAIIMGPLVTTWPAADYLKSPGVAAYVIKTLALITGSAPLPGVFARNPTPDIVNSSLWTLKYEVLCYVVLGGLGFLALWLGRIRDLALLAAGTFVIACLARQPALKPDNGLLANVHYFALFFGTGVACYALRRWLFVSPLLLPLFIAGAALAVGTRMAEIGFALAIGYGIFVLGALIAGPIRRFTNDSDYSYGFFIYSMPVTQLLLHIWPNLNVVSLVLATLGLTLLLAFASWEIIERPALEFGRFLRQRTAPSRTVSAPQSDGSAPTPAVVPAAATARESIQPPPHLGDMPARPTTAQTQPETPANPMGNAAAEDAEAWRAWVGGSVAAPTRTASHVQQPKLGPIWSHATTVTGRPLMSIAPRRASAPPVPPAAPAAGPAQDTWAPIEAGSPHPTSAQDFVQRILRNRLAKAGLARSQAEIDAELAPANADRSQHFLRRMNRAATAKANAQATARQKTGLQKTGLQKTGLQKTGLQKTGPVVLQI